MTQLSAASFEAPDKYAAYLRTTEGRLRVDLAWANLQGFLPVSSAGDRALGAQPLFAAIARYTQLIARARLIQSGRETGK